MLPLSKRVRTITRESRAEDPKIKRPWKDLPLTELSRPDCGNSSHVYDVHLGRDAGALRNVWNRSKRCCR